MKSLLLFKRIFILIVLLGAICFFEQNACGQDGNFHPSGKGQNPLSGGSDYPDSVRLYYAAIEYGDGFKDYRKAVDTVRRYCEEHPYAVPCAGCDGHVRDGIRKGTGWAGSLGYQLKSQSPYYEQYNWILTMSMYNLNDIGYQVDIYISLATMLDAIDTKDSRNAFANLLYNFTLLFHKDPNNDSLSRQDSFADGQMWRSIASMRSSQKLLGDDTTEFTILPRPLKPLVYTAINHDYTPASMTVSIAPNPISNEAVVSYNLAERGYVYMTIFDEMGREVQTVVSEMKDAGDHSENLSVGNLPSGQYYLRTVYKEKVGTKKFIIKK